MQALPAPTTWRQCEFCWHKAVCDVKGQWTIFDWLDVSVCNLHIDAGVRLVQSLWIGNQQVASITFFWYDDQFD